MRYDDSVDEVCSECKMYKIDCEHCGDFIKSLNLEGHDNAEETLPICED